MRSVLVAGALTVLCGLTGILLQLSSSPGPGRSPGRTARTDPTPLPRTGAWKAFEWWYAQRAYPHPLIPRGAFRRAHEEKRSLARRPVKSGRQPSSVSQWESMGPDNIGGRVLAIAVHPFATSRVFVGSASGGLWKTSSSGTGSNPWTRIETGFPTLSVSAIAIDPVHPDTMYIGTGEISRYVRPLVGVVGARASYGLGILKSTDGGATWDTTGLSWAFENVTAVQEIVINPLNTSTLYAATSEGVYKSGDGGATWSVSNPELMAMDLVINPADTTILISSHGNLNSTANPGLYMTFNAGGDWAKLEGGLPASNFGRTSLSISASNPSIVYAGVSNASSSGIIGLYRSTTGGLTWNLASATNYVGSQGWYDNVIAVHPTDPATVYCAGFNIHKTTNSGANLPDISAGSVHVDHHAIAFDPADPRTVYFGSDGGIYKSTDSGTTFIDLNDGFVTTQFYPGFSNASDDSTIALGGLQDNGTLKYIGGPSWIPVWGGDGGWCAVDPANKNTLYAESQYGRIVRSYTGGGSFMQVTSGLPSGTADWNFIPPFVISPSNPQVLYAGSRTVYKTTNQGSLWTATGGSTSLNGTNVACIAVSRTSSDTLLAGTGSGALGGSPLFQIFSSTSGGASWTNVTGALPDRYPTDLEFDPTDSRKAYLTYSGYGTPHVFRTTNLGASWTSISGGLPDMPHQCIAVDPVYPEYLYVGTDLGVFQSSDGGANWTEYSEGMPEAMVLDLTVSEANDALRASTFGNGVYQRRLPRFPVLALDYPVGGEILVGGDIERIRWTQAYTDLLRVEYSSNGGGAWTTVADSVEAEIGYFDWTVPALATTQGVIRLTGLGGGPADSGASPFTILVNPDVLGGWNMISIPVVPPNYLKDSLFPTSVSNAFEYSKGYQVRDTLSNGKSFWLKFGAPQFTDLSGAPLYADSVNLLPGWNMIGSITEPVAVDNIQEHPPGIVASLLYEYRGGYDVADSIMPGRGYWVKAGAAGWIVLSSDFRGGSPPSALSRPRASLSALTITDASGFSQTLYFSEGEAPATGLSRELPPLPPAGAADIRFASGLIAEYFGGEDPPERAISLRGLKSPLRIDWLLEPGDRRPFELRTGGEPSMIAGPSGSLVLDRIPPSFSLAAGEGAVSGTPEQFRLEQNYPNPFNPLTTIAFLLPSATRIRLTVYDNLGREVAVLADGPEPAGGGTRVWNAAGYASGVYLYRLTADGRSATGKMLLLR